MSYQMFMGGVLVAALWFFLWRDKTAWQELWGAIRFRNKRLLLLQGFSTFALVAYVSWLVFGVEKWLFVPTLLLAVGGVVGVAVVCIIYPKPPKHR